MNIIKSKKGFVFIETLLTVVVLMTSLLLIYSSYSSTIADERERLYKDDISFMYRTKDIKNFLIKNSNITTPTFINLNFYDNAMEPTKLIHYIVPLGSGLDTLFRNVSNPNVASPETVFGDLISNYNVHQLAVVKKDYIENCTSENKDDDKCKSNLPIKMKKYIDSLNDTDYDYYLVAMYAERQNKDGQKVNCIPYIDNNSLSNDGNNLFPQNSVCKVGFAHIGFYVSDGGMP